MTWYVDASGGNDSSDGRSPSGAIASLERVNEIVGAGDTVLFRRGEVFRGQLIPVSGRAGQPTTYGAYGTGAKPELRGSVDMGSETDWVDTEGNRWRSSTTFSTDVGNLIFNDATQFGQKEWSLGDLAAQGDYYYDRSTGYLTVYSTGNPASFYTAIEAAIRLHIVDQQSRSYVTYENLALRYGAAHGFGGGNTHHITIRTCDISYIGGGDLDMDGSNVRFGNGIEFWANAHDNLVERNRIWEIYDTALSNQNHTTVVQQYNITYRNNVMWNNGMASFEYWSRPEQSSTWNIRFEHNTALGAGEGWGAPPQRPVTDGVHLLLSYSPASATDIVIQNNIFVGGNLAIYVSHAHQWETSLSLDGNLYYKAAGALMHINDRSPNPVFEVSEFTSWQTESSKDGYSMVADPLFTDAAGEDFSLSAGSPAIDAGLTGPVSVDFLGLARPSGAAPDIGAYERH